MAGVTPESSDGTADAISVDVGEERETGAGWAYDVTVSRGPDQARLVGITMSWRDHDDLCGGALSPSRVVEACVRVAAAQTERLPERADVSTLRKLTPDFGVRVRQALAGEVDGA